MAGVTVRFRSSSGKLGTQDSGVVPCLPAERRTTELPGCPVLATASRGPNLDHISSLSSILSVKRRALGPWSFNTRWVLNRRGVRNDKREKEDMRHDEQHDCGHETHDDLGIMLLLAGSSFGIPLAAVLCRQLPVGWRFWIAVCVDIYCTFAISLENTHSRNDGRSEQVGPCPEPVRSRR